MRILAALLLVVPLLFACGATYLAEPAPLSATATPLAAGMYQNPINIAVSGGKQMESCPDPSILRSQTPGDNAWYIYCTEEMFTDHAPLHLMAMARSEDLVHWNYVGDVFKQLPPGVASDGLLWAPDIEYFNGQYFLYYVASNTPRGGTAIFVATSTSPAGPWTPQPDPVVEPEPADCCGGQPRWTIDPAIVEENGTRYMIYGSFYGGISARELSPDGLHTSRASEVAIAPPYRYEAAYVVKHDGYFYLMLSAGDCCSGDLSGYGVFALRSQRALGPYTDRDGHMLLEPRVGGTPVLLQNGNRWVGPGHNATFTDANGQDWMIYHAIDVNKPTFAGSWTRRPVMMDRIDWVDGWPTVRGGAGPSDGPEPAPAATSKSSLSNTVATTSPGDRAGAAIPNASDDFSSPRLSSQWKWIRNISPTSWQVGNGGLRFDTQAGDIYQGQHDAALLTEAAPSGNYIVETRLSMNVPLYGEHNYAQGGVMIYKDDGNYVKLVVDSIGPTRQIEFAKQTTASGSPKYGKTYLGAPSDSTWLRIVRRVVNGQELYTAYSSQDGQNWTRGGTWKHSLGGNTRIALVSMAGAGFSSQFSYVHVSTLAN
ncbi:MAG TPA: family 43 glycosylhydrolase [Candidatus Acidoferrales bacterium]|nr:family 43 glycosylhydrolase [Candidatus Acidoferrales bacterium]